MKFTYNNPTVKKIRQRLRVNQTSAEKLVWSKLRNKQLFGLKFYRQYSVGKYVLDFYCPSIKLAIEIDGGQHNDTAKLIKDNSRTLFLKSKNIKIIRFWNNDVLSNLEGVLSRIKDNL